MRISYVNGICVLHDAISAAIRNEIGWLTQSGQHEVRLFAYQCDFDDVKAKKVTELSDVAFDPFFQTSDLVIFHFGIYYPLFNLLPIVPIAATRIVVFHNVTPKQFVSIASHATIDRSFVQMASMSLADVVICDSNTNLRVLREAGIDVPAMVVPLAIEPRGDGAPSKPSQIDGVFRIAFVGRFVRAKGVLDLLGALARLARPANGYRLQVDLIGNVAFSDPVTLDQAQTMIDAFQRVSGDWATVTIRGDAKDEEKHAILAAADLFVLPSYHEGFCVPILEAMTHHCSIITYDNSNLPDITGGHAMLVPTGDCTLLTEAIAEQISDAALQGNADISRTKPDRGEIQRHLDRFSIGEVRRQFLGAIERTVRHPRFKVGHA